MTEWQLIETATNDAATDWMPFPPPPTQEDKARWYELTDGHVVKITDNATSWLSPLPPTQDAKE